MGYGCSLAEVEKPPYPKAVKAVSLHLLVGEGCAIVAWAYVYCSLQSTSV